MKDKPIYKYKSTRLFATDTRNLFVIRNRQTSSSLLFNLESTVELKRFLKDYYYGKQDYGVFAFRKRLDPLNTLDKKYHDRFVFLTEKCGVSSNFLTSDDVDGIIKALDFVISKYGLRDKTRKEEMITIINKIKSVKKEVE